MFELTILSALFIACPRWLPAIFLAIGLILWIAVFPISWIIAQIMFGINHFTGFLDNY